VEGVAGKENVGGSQGRDEGMGRATDLHLFRVSGCDSLEQSELTAQRANRRERHGRTGDEEAEDQ
jgi:hypothetical protein